MFKGVVVAPHVPRTEGGLYWGYNVRLASSLSTPLTLAAHVLQSDFFLRLAADAGKLKFTCCFTVTAGGVFSESPYDEGYDATVGTSERGGSIDQMTLPPFK